MNLINLKAVWYTPSTILALWKKEIKSFLQKLWTPGVLYRLLQKAQPTLAVHLQTEHHISHLDFFSGNKKKIFIHLLADMASPVLSCFSRAPKSALSSMKVLPSLKMTYPMKSAANIEDRAMLWQTGSSVLAQPPELGRFIFLLFHCASSRTGAHNTSNATYSS